MRVGQKVAVTKYYRNENRNIKTEVVPGTIVSPVKYTKDGILWHWCVLEA